MFDLVEVHEGLSAIPKRFDNHSFMYDDRGSELFDNATRDEAYYTYKNDFALITKNAPEIAHAVGKNIVLVDFGCGMCSKSICLLKALEDVKMFVPNDIDPSVLELVRAKLEKEMPEVKVVPVPGNFTKKLDLPPGKRLGMLTGNSIAVYDDQDTANIVRTCLDNLGPEGVFLTSFDANQDPSCVTDQYNKSCFPHLVMNTLSHMNNKLGTNFDVSAFYYSCIWNEEKKRVDHFLISKENQEVKFDGKTYFFEKDEKMRIFYGRKRSISEFENIVQSVGATVKRVFMDPQQYVCLAWIENM